MSRITDRKEALETLDKIKNNKKEYYFIHYSCESYNVIDGKAPKESPKISSIAVYNPYYEQSELFTIYKSAERNGIDVADIKEKYDEIEKSMLEDFFTYLERYREKTWIHWKMTNSIFGFKAIEHRYQVLLTKVKELEQVIHESEPLSEELQTIKHHLIASHPKSHSSNTPYSLPDSKQIDLSSLLRKLYGPNYVKNEKLESLMKNNKINPTDFLPGADEAKLFKDGQYYIVSKSTASKVEMFSRILDLAIDNSLITDIPALGLYGTTLKGKWHTLKEKSWFLPVSFVVTSIISAVIGHYVTIWLHV